MDDGSESGGDSNILTGVTRQETDESLTQAILMPSNACVITVNGPVQSVQFEIDRWSAGDSNSKNYYVVDTFTVPVDASWYRSDGNLYTP